jgi:hypothetical protein
MTDNLPKDECMVGIYGLRHIWKERCRRVFQLKVMTEAQFIELIKDDLLLLGIYLMKHDTSEGELEPGFEPDVSSPLLSLFLFLSFLHRFFPFCS